MQKIVSYARRSRFIGKLGIQLLTVVGVAAAATAYAAPASADIAHISVMGRFWDNVVYTADYVELLPDACLVPKSAKPTNIGIDFTISVTGLESVAVYDNASGCSGEVVGTASPLEPYRGTLMNGPSIKLPSGL
ncbi:hypothetical protein [Nocardia australiensis]|uniref:hypothetical protein n=1 Tax=Nocardia australiensis TaxID=2887191 RepID=UPI001D13DC1F|nr:hypothetical protein [Nocardia australiensis]